MKIHSRKKKPEVGMELTVTFSFPVDATPEESAQTLVDFFQYATEAKLGFCWLKMLCTNIPVELEDRIAAGVDASNAALEMSKPNLRLVVSN